jgi:hypothetical protein
MRVLEKAGLRLDRWSCATDHGDDLGHPEAPEIGVLPRAAVDHRALEGSD